MPPRVCAVWDCRETIRHDHVVCLEHYPGMKAGELDKCPDCGRLKEAKYDKCLECYHKGQRKAPAVRTRKKPTRKRTTPEVAGAPDAKPQKDADTGVFHVYVCVKDDGKYYVGQTNHLPSRMLEHQRKATSGNEPSMKLVWFSYVRTRDEAGAYEAYLSELTGRNERAVTRMVVEFKQLVAELNG